MQRITIAKVESKPTKTGNTYTKLTGDKGGVFSGFDVGLSILTPGAVIDAEIEVQGKYANIKSYTVVSNITPPPPQAPARQTEAVTPIPSQEPRTASTNSSIEFQVCLKEVGECIRWNDEAVPYAARTGYWKAICERLGTAGLYEEAKPEPTVVKDTTGAVKSTTESHLVDEVKKMTAEIKPATPTAPVKPATKAQTDRITQLMLGKDASDRAKIYIQTIGIEAPTSLSVEQANKVIDKLQGK